MRETMTIDVRDNPQRSRFELTVDDQRAGFLDYVQLNSSVALSYTQVDPRHTRHGHGKELVRFALDDLRERGRTVLPLCGFVNAFIAEHPEYLDMVPADQRRRFNLDSR